MAFATGTVAASFRDALLAAVQTALVASDPQPLMVLGTPADFVGQDVISVGEVDAQMVAATLGPQRAMDEQITAQVRISVSAMGGQEAEQVASDRALAYLQTLEAYLRFTDPYVGATVQRAYVSAYSVVSDAWTDDTTDGRAVELLVTVTAWQRSQRPS